MKPSWSVHLRALFDITVGVVGHLGGSDPRRITRFANFVVMRVERLRLVAIAAYNNVNRQVDSVRRTLIPP